MARAGDWQERVGGALVTEEAIFDSGATAEQRRRVSIRWRRTLTPAVPIIRETVPFYWFSEEGGDGGVEGNLVILEAKVLAALGGFAHLLG